MKPGTLRRNGAAEHGARANDPCFFAPRLAGNNLESHSNRYFTPAFSGSPLQPGSEIAAL